MLGRRLLWRRAAWLGVPVAASAMAQTEQQPPGIRLDYEADSHCPVSLRSPDAFVSEVHARSARVRFAQDAQRKLVVRMVRDARHNKLGGRIEVHETDGTRSERTVSGATCEEVVSALGLVTALALDPLASTQATATAATSTASAPPSATVTSTAATSTAPPPVADAGAPTRAADAGAEVPLERRPWSFGAGADVEAVFGATPGPLLAVPVFFEATRAFGEHVGIGGGLRFERAGQTSVDASGVGADFTWTAAALDLCLVLRSGRLRWNGCARVTGAAIDARGEGVVPQRSATRPWVDLGVSTALRFRIAAPVFIEIAGQFGVALVQDTFIVEPSTTVFQPPGFVGHVGGGLGFEIW